MNAPKNKNEQRHMSNQKDSRMSRNESQDALRKEKNGAHFNQKQHHDDKSARFQANNQNQGKRK